MENGAIILSMMLLVAEISGSNMPGIGLHMPGRAMPFLHEVSALSLDDKIDGYIAASAERLGPGVSEAVAGIDGQEKKLLAVRYYLRSAGRLRYGWTWSASQIARFKGSTEYRRALAEVEKVKAKFAELNPGYELRVDTEVRTLEMQLVGWNMFPSVALAAEQVSSAIVPQLADTIFPHRPDAESLGRFNTLLTGALNEPTPSVAVPGLSQHGQLRAFDFEIWKGGVEIAGTDFGTIPHVWDRPGWTKKLRTAITEAGAKFSGPLQSPREPWHYTSAP